MEDEAAEIELLEQNLNKTRKISQKMTSILTSFDNRLLKLEKSILPLHESTQLLNRRAANVESTLQLIDEVAGSREGLAAEEALILRGPQSTDLRTYIDALERMNATIAFQGSNSDSRDTARLVETGAKKLAQLYTKLVAEGSAGAPPTTSSTPQFPPALLATLSPLVSFLRTLPLPATHPSHPAAVPIATALESAQRGYADMRGGWAMRALEGSSRRATERAEKAEAGGGREVRAWVEGLLDVADAEYSLLTELAVLPSSTQFSATYSTLITPINTLFSSTQAGLLSTIKRALHKHTFLALSCYAALSDPGLSARWDDMMQRRAGRPPARDNALREALQALRAVCLRSFPEFLADVKLAATGGQGPGAVGAMQTGVIDITTSVVKYMESIPAVQDAVGSMLITLGDGNWKMGEGVQVGKGQKLGEGDEAIVLEHYLFDIVMTTLNTLTTLARSTRRAAFGGTFLLNNVAYLRTVLVLSGGELSSLLAPPAVDALQSAFRTARAGYFDAHFAPLVQVLGDDPREKRAAAKERFTRFYELLDEVIENHRVARLLPGDDEAREAVLEDVVKLVVPSLQRFIQKNKEKEFSKNPQKYIKMSPEEVENRLRNLY